MTKPIIRLILSDIDGTLLNTNHEVTPELKGVMAEVCAQEISFVLTSARSPLGMTKIQEELGLKTPLAAYNGAYISDYQAKKPFFSLPVDLVEAKKVILRAFHSYPHVAINIYAGEKWVVPKRNQWVIAEEKITGMKAEEVELNRFLAQEPEIHKVLFIATNEEIATLENSLSKIVLLESSSYRSKENYLEFTHKKISKALALEKLAEYYQVPLSNTMAIGDHDNDAGMIGAAGMGIAMANGSVAARNKADFITADNNHNGVAIVLKQLVSLAKRED